MISVILVTAIHHLVQITCFYINSQYEFYNTGILLNLEFSFLSSLLGSQMQNFCFSCWITYFNHIENVLRLKLGFQFKTELFSTENFHSIWDSQNNCKVINLKRFADPNIITLFLPLINIYIIYKILKLCQTIIVPTFN